MGCDDLVFDKDVGTTIRLDTGSDLVGAISVAIYAKSPSGSVSTLSASVVPGTTYIQHIKTANTLSTPGAWQLQAYVKFADGSEYYGEPVTLIVRPAMT